MRATFVKILQNLADKNKDILLITADLGKFFSNFQEAHPSQFLNAGIAEPHMISMAAGLALSGKNVYCYSMSTFLIMRALEQIRVDVCYHNLNVKLLGAGGGLSYGLEGMTHQAVEDLAILRALPNMTIFCPGDPVELKAIAKESVSYPCPLYIRFGKDDRPQIHRSSLKVKIGKGIMMTVGKDVVVIATGSMLYPAKIAADNLAKRGIKITLISMPTVKPIDVEMVKKLKKYKAILTVEEHSIIGGLGDAVGSVLLESQYSGLFQKMGLPDKYSCHIGHYDHLCKKYHLTHGDIIRQILKCKQKI